MLSRRHFLKIAGSALLLQFGQSFGYAQQEAFTAWGQSNITFAQLQSTYETLGL